MILLSHLVLDGIGFLILVTTKTSLVYIFVSKI